MTTYHIEPDAAPPDGLILPRQGMFGVPPIPVVRLSQDKQWLMWEFADAKRIKPFGSMVGALEAVVSIVRVDASPVSVIAARVLPVAARYGPLFMRQYGYQLTPEEWTSVPILPWEHGSERITEWIDFATEIRDLIGFASALSSADKFEDVKHLPVGRKISETYSGIVRHETNGEVVVGGGPVIDRAKSRGLPITLSHATLFVEQRVDDLASRSKLKPTVQWSHAKNRFEFGFEPGQSGLYGSVLLELMLKIGGATRWMSCDSCQTFYHRDLDRRMPGRSKLNFCDECSIDDGLKRTAQRNRKKQDGVSTK